MNIITKIKNWIIKKLGGYTVEVFTRRVSDAERVWNDLNDIKERRIRNLKNCIKCWNSVYNAEHENYLALLNAHNATADYAKSISYAADTDYIHKTDVAAMAKAIKEHCENHWACSECALYELPNGCKLAELPCYWEVE